MSQTAFSSLSSDEIVAGVRAHRNAFPIDLRDLHAQLSVPTTFPTWVRQKIDADVFTEGLDYTRTIHPAADPGKQPRIDYPITVDAARFLIASEQAPKSGAILDEINQLFPPQPPRPDFDCLPTLVPVTTSVIGAHAVPTVDAADLHEFIRVEMDFVAWIIYGIRSNFLTQDVDFAVDRAPRDTNQTSRRRPVAGYRLTLDAANSTESRTQFADSLGLKL